MPQPKNPNPTKVGPRYTPARDEPSPPKKKQNENPTKEGVRGPAPGKGR